MSIKSLLVVVSLVLSVAIGLALHHGSDSKEGKRLLIGMSLDTLKEARWQMDQNFFSAKVKELGGDVTVLAANSDDAVQKQVVTSMLSQGVDVLVIAPHNGQAMASAVELAHKKGVPVISYDRLISDCPLDMYMSFDNFEVGRLQGQYCVDQIPKLKHGRPLNLVRIYGAKTDHNAVLFKEGQDAALKDPIAKGDIKIVHEDWAEDWKPENAKRIMNAAIANAGHDIDGVLASNDGTATGAIQALIEANMIDKVFVTGQDAEIIACQRIVQGTQAMTIYKPIKKLAETAAETAMAMAQHKPIFASAQTNNSTTETANQVPSILFPAVVVTKENMDDTVIKDGFHTREEVYAK